MGDSPAAKWMQFRMEFHRSLWYARSGKEGRRSLKPYRRWKMMTIMDDLVILGMMLVRLGVPILMMALAAVLLNRVDRSPA